MSFCLWVGCPLSHGWRRASVSAAASVGDGRSPLGCITRAGRREWTRVSEDGEGKLPAAPSHGLCGSAGGRPSQSPNGDSSPEGGAKSRLPLWGALVPGGHRSALDRAGRREWTRVSEDGEGKLPAAPSHGLCGSAGGLPSQSPNGDSSPEGGAKSRPPPLGPAKKFCPPPDAKQDTRRHRMSCFL